MTKAVSFHNSKTRRFKFQNPKSKSFDITTFHNPNPYIVENRENYYGRKQRERKFHHTHVCRRGEKLTKYSLLYA